MADTARWCSLCHTRFDAPPPPVAKPPPEFSRWRGNEVTLGGRARLVWTAVILLLPLWFLAYAGAFGIVGAVGWWFCVAPVALRDVWRRARL
ncbi:MAG TPA: hypothetical protein VGX28_10260 [Frankiaceae bacterium]|nr:hypothetical protein [Frankiaceae bacterium]